MITVVGGGPAGCSAAIRLAQAGMPVQLYEKAHFPRRKLCGGFLSPEALNDLEELGLRDEILRNGAHRIHRTLVSAPSGRYAESELPAPALSISRDRLDSLLLHRARAVGVEVYEGTRAPKSADEDWRILASGRLLSSGGRVRGGKALYGIQAFFSKIPAITSTIELHGVKSGYVGMVQQGSLVNVCALTTRDVFQTEGTDLDDVLKAWLRINPLLRHRFQPSQRQSGWLAVGPVQLGIRQLTDTRCLFTGDAACGVDPFVGEGMAMALRSGTFIQDAFQQSAEPIETFYARRWHAHFDSSLRFHRWARKLMQVPPLYELTVGSLKVFPTALTWLTQLTRPPLYANRTVS